MHMNVLAAAAAQQNAVPQPPTINSVRSIQNCTKVKITTQEALFPSDLRSVDFLIS